MSKKADKKITNIKRIIFERLSVSDRVLLLLVSIDLPNESQRKE